MAKPWPGHGQTMVWPRLGQAMAREPAQLEIRARAQLEIRAEREPCSLSQPSLALDRPRLA